MKTKMSNQFLRNFLVIFLLTILDTVLAFVLLSFTSGLISDSLAKNKYPASAIIKEDYRLIDASPVVENGGGVQVVDKDYRVVYSRGLDTIGKDNLTTEEFTTFLTESKSKPYHYDILYHPKGEFWLIVTFPTSIRLDFSLVHNKEASIGDFMRAGWAITIVALSYLLILALFAFIYSRITAASITVPLKKLCDGTRLLREGDYSVRVDLRLKNEFAELQNTFNDMATRIEHEISMRKKSEEDRRRLILDISHDLKNPMSSIQGYAELLIKKTGLMEQLSKTGQTGTTEQSGTTMQSGMTEQECEDYLKAILNNSKRANRLLTELFELSQMDSPEFSLKLERSDICEYLRQICGELVPQLEQEGFKYEFEIPDEGVFVMLDTDRFGRIIHNLASNAIRYNPKGTLVSVNLSEQDHQVVINFSDNGIGIPAHLTDNIFKPFVRVDDSRNYKTGGSGLGLSIAKKIAEAHGGDLTLCLNENKGSTFRITLPTI